MSFFIAIQSTYHSVEFALFKGSACLEVLSESKIDATKNFVTTLNKLLTKHNLKLSDLICIGVNRGPGPFTTLRVAITSVNGIAFAGTTKLIGVSGLKVFLDELQNPEYPNTVALLNAFNKDVYFAIENDTERSIGYKKIDTLLEQLKKDMIGKTVRFVGNGTDLHYDAIIFAFGDNAFIPDDNPKTVSIQQVGKAVFDKLQNNEVGENQLLPLYIKEQKFDFWKQ